MGIKIGINGMGRIGRCTLASIIENQRDDVQVIKINATGPIETNAYLLKYDSVHGRFKNEIKVDGDTMDIGKGPMKVFSSYDPADLDWSEVDVLLECSGKFKSRDSAQLHIDQGARLQSFDPVWVVVMAILQPLGYIFLLVWVTVEVWPPQDVAYP